ncbi:MAG: hypothetical protein DRO11_06290, partial [Methanobacteriota archaeon]
MIVGETSISITFFLIELGMVLWFTSSLFLVFWMDSVKAVSISRILFLITVFSMLGVGILGLGVMHTFGPFRGLSEKMESLDVHTSFETLFLGYTFLVLAVLLTNLLANSGKLHQL